ncbi:Crp/Fnr family transcriptional regulator [Azohydromonas sediminis]|uniref:Crp/Fnr family transcriptional regulator n=1 Tax=Azohydromonas sediminis TaxID=2259674 RepID=UPI0013C37BD8|nr:Crp/Fnr family transcriptional regulator [Azohydromonas sediminis]
MKSKQDTVLCPWPGGPAAAAPQHPLCQMCAVVDRVPPESALAADGLPPAVRMPLRAGVRLFEQGTVAQAVYVVQSGIVKETLRDDDSGECIARLVMRGGVAGIGGLSGPHPHSGHVIHPGYACRIPMARFEKVLAEHPDALPRLYADGRQAIADADRIIGQMCHGPARARLARALLYLRSTLAPGEALRLKRADLAQLMALNPTSVARLLAEFRRDGLLEQQGRYCVAVDAARLRELAHAEA